MTTINVPTRDEVSPANQAIFDQLKSSLGTVPNLYATLPPISPRPGGGTGESSRSAMMVFPKTTVTRPHLMHY